MRILFVTSTRIGDAVLSTGLLAHLLSTHPGARITVACGPAAAPLFAAVPGLERVLVLDKKPFAGHWRRFWRETVGTRWDVIVDLRGSPFTWLLRRGRRYAYHTDRAPVHRVVKLSAVLGLDPPVAPRLWTAPGHESFAEARVGRGAPPLALAPTANWPGKEWPVDRFIALTDRLTGPGGPLAGAPVMVLGAAHERPAAAPLIEALGARAIDLTGAGLLESYACLRRAALFVGNDSGLMHIAAAAGIPVLGLFGPTRDEHYAPWGPRGAVVRTPESADALMGRVTDITRPPCLMESLGVDAVEAAARTLLRREGEAAAAAGG